MSAIIHLGEARYYHDMALKEETVWRPCAHAGIIAGIDLALDKIAKLKMQNQRLGELLAEARQERA